jgi:hypothetical protein
MPKREQFLSIEVPRSSRAVGIPIEVERKDLLQSEVYEELAGIVSAHGQR